MKLAQEVDPRDLAEPSSSTGAGPSWAAGESGWRLARQDRALAVVAHELRQPLSIIRLSAATLQRLPESSDATRVRSIVDRIDRAVESQARIIEDLLDLARARTGKIRLQRVDVDVAKLVEEIVQAFNASLSADVIRIDGVGLPLVCHADPVRLKQIVGNLLGNAIKFSAMGERVVVRVSAEAGFAKLSVADSGCGIPADLLPEVFDLFTQGAAGAAQDGLGIGLALVHGLTLAHGGFVKAASKGVGRGAEFSVWLPLAGHVVRTPHEGAVPSETGRD